MRRAIILLVIFLLLLAAPSAVRYLQHYRLNTPQRTAPASFDPTAVQAVATPGATNFTDEPAVGSGVVLLDRAHGNDFTQAEIGYLDGRLSQRGFDLVPFTGGDLATALRPADSFIVITPLKEFPAAEVRAVRDFVNRGGRLLLIGDPTRFDLTVEETMFEFVVTLETDEIPLNSLANAFDISFNGDYLYNTVENEGNFRNIIVTGDNLAASDITAGISQLAFYGAHSLQVGPTGTPLVLGDDDTWSSATDRPGGLALGVASRDGHVLALGDIHFLVEPYYTVYDNGRFIAQIADFLTGANPRQRVLSDFPFFFGDEVALAYAGSPDLGPDAFDEIIALQEAFRGVSKTLSLTAVSADDQPGLVLGIYNQAGDVNKILEAAGISLLIDPPVTPAAAGGDDADEEAERTGSAQETAVRVIQSTLGNVQMSGSALLLLDETAGAPRLIILAASGEGLENTVNRLLDMMSSDPKPALSDCLLQGSLALCPTGVENEPVEAELETGGTPDRPEEEEEEEEEEAEEEEETTAGIPEAVEQGAIQIGETVEGVLAEAENHTWTFAEGPAVIDITLDSGDDLDAVLELYNPDEELIYQADSSFTGGVEELIAVEITDDGTYTILVRDFFEDGGSYTLTVAESTEEPQTAVDGGIFIFADDDGIPITDDVVSTLALAALLEDDYEVTTWFSSTDGPLPDDALNGYELVIWDSGDYQDEEGFLGDDAVVLINYIENGGDVFVTGSAPPLLTGLDLAPLATVVVAGDDPVLLNGLSAGDLIELDRLYETVSSQLDENDVEPGSVAFFLRGPDDEDAGSVVGLAAPENAFNDQKTVILLIPFIALPADIQEILLSNIIAWFGITGS